MNKLLLTLLTTLLPSLLAAQVSVTHLRTENLENPLGIDTPAPRFSWQITTTNQKLKDVRQTAYQIIVSTDKGELWNSGRVESDAQLWVPYQGPALKSNQHCTWQLKVFTNRGETPWSEPQRFSTGLLNESKWSGRWIGLERLMPGEERGLHSRLAARYQRKEFQLQDKPVKRATAFVAGLGLYEFFVNGECLNQTVLTPVPSDYRKTIYYNTYDITAQLRKSAVPLLQEGSGEVHPKYCIGIILGNGRQFAMRQDKPYKNVTFGLPKCRINIIVEYEDGTTERLSTDEKWRVTANGPIRANNEYDGEEYDARMEMPGWSEVGFDDSQWLQAERTEIPTGTLRAQMTEGMGECGILTPHSSLHTPRHILDFGQNLSGWVSFLPQGKPGDTIRIRYAERLNDDGTLYIKNLRDARSTDIYVCGQNNSRWHPTFVYHGFRYVEVIGPATDFKAHLVTDQMENTGSFACSDTILNKVVRNAWWGIASNYKGMPVDCPQRNERQPWLGDRTVGALGESFLFGNERLYTKWMRDICESQRSDGCIPDVAPSFWNYYTDDVTWPAALPFCCDMLWRQYGNPQPVIDSYPYIRKWMLHIIEEYTRDGIITKDKYGDWCVPPEKPELIHSQDPARKTDGALIATAYTIRCLQLLEQFAALAGADDAAMWRTYRQQYVEAFNRKFLTVRRGTSPRHDHTLYPDSIFYGNNTATANLLALSFGIVPDTCRDDVARHVVENIVIQNKNHVSCGVIGISWLLRGLSDNGFSDVAYRLATNADYPSWGYMAEHGATTIWELWNGDTADPAMNSGNHVMLLGDLLTWCYQYLGGIRQDGVGYKHILLKPDLTIPDCFWADVTWQSPRGPIVSRWKKSLQQLQWHVEIPCNTTADLCLPSGEIRTLGSGAYDLTLDIPTQHPSVLKREFLYETAPFPQCHASTIVETRKGDLVVAYFGGTKERNPDCCIWVSIKKKGNPPPTGGVRGGPSSSPWQAPLLAADGMVNGEKTACWNPVLFEMPDGELWLFYKVGVTVAEWTGWLAKSRDGGRTWSKGERLPDGFLGPIKNKPILIGDRLVCGSSTEADGWRFHVEIYDLKTRKWRYVGPIESTVATKTDDNQPHPIDCIQPSILQLSDGRLQVLMRTHNARLATSYSSDGGETWTPVTLSEVENNQSGTDAVTLRDGSHALIYNNFETLPLTKKGPRNPLSVALSPDGQHWSHYVTLESSPMGEFSYPAIIQGRDGTLHCVYTWRRERIAYQQIKLKQ
ncbi:MAG: family 78 glycoside hydrolase catalytic domain [Prevotella sp.]|nr:family 78 glycoside hydrolase catalytic domain [Prevotella sp.]